MEIQCSSCHKRLKLPDNAAGKKIRCPICQNVFQVSAPSPEPEPILEKSPEIDMGFSEPTSSVLGLPPEHEELSEEPASNHAPDILEMIASSKRDIEKATIERDEAMEMVDGIFQMFMERADNPDLSTDEQQEYRQIAQKIFGLQRRFPILGGIKNTLELCEKNVTQK